MRLYAMSLKIEGRRCVVVGGGSVAERKVASLRSSGALVVVVSPALCPELERSASTGAIEVVRRAFRPEDIEGAFLVIAATNVPTVNEAVADAARRSGILVNVVDVPEQCDFYVPASFSRGDLEIAVSTSGACPALAKKIRMELDQQFGPEYEKYLEMLGQLRRELKERVQDRQKRQQAEQSFLDSPALSLLSQNKTDDAEQILQDCIARFTR